MEYTTPSAGKIRATVPQSQSQVEYRLMQGNRLLATQRGNGKDLQFDTNAQSGDYYVTALYAGKSLQLNGVSIIESDIIKLSHDRNWILSTTYVADNITASDAIYYDGLGAVRQSVALYASPAAGANFRGNLVQQTEYDAWHRAVKNYLPYVATKSNGAYVESFDEVQDLFYRQRLWDDYDGSMFAYVKAKYENTPLNRQQEGWSPGHVYREFDRFKRFSHSCNIAGRVLCLNAGSDGSLSAKGYYAANELFSESTTDEDGQSLISYTDKSGRVVLQSNYSSQLQADDGTNADTYFVYDDQDRLAWVISPEGAVLLTSTTSFTPDSEFARKYCYIYTNDSRGRIVGKRMPGQVADSLVYDLGDRLVMSQDGNQRAQQKWRLYIYNKLGRIVAEYLVSDGRSHKVLQESFDLNPDNLPIYNVSGLTLLQDYKYDTYTGIPTALQFSNISEITGNTSGVSLRDNRTTGLKTFERVALLGTSNVFQQRAFYYDYKSRLIQSVVQDPDGGVLRTSLQYDLAGNVLTRQERFTAVGIDDVLTTRFTYDPRGRMLKETAMLNGGQAGVVEYTYDEVGMLSGKRYGTGTNAVTETLTYNIQGWLTKKTSGLFDMRLKYFYPERGSEAKYAGTISELDWQHKKVNGTVNGTSHTYGFRYDKQNRLSNTLHYAGNALSEQFRERDLAYDRNGNVRSLTRTDNNGSAETFTFNYSGNCRTSVDELEKVYDYDYNGNVTIDPVNNFEISYNMLNFPEMISSLDEGGTLRYSYLADGSKTSIGNYDDAGYSYKGSLVYEQNSGLATRLESAAFGGGRLYPTGVVHYYLTDHLGSTRLIVDGSTGMCVERNDYYPYGSVWSNPDMPTVSSRYKFSGKELQVASGASAPYLDFGARLLDTKGITWTSPDLLSEEDYSISSYVYCRNNPILLWDPNGIWK